MDSNNHPNSQSQSQPYYSLNNFPYHRFSPNANISFSQIPSFSAQTSSPPVEAASQPEKTPRERRIWTSSDDLVLISGWLYTSKDVIIGNDQRAGAFWKRIGDYYASSTHVLGGAEPRLPDHCRQRWQKIQKMVARFCGFYAEAFSEKASGMNDLDIINNAHQLYYKLYKKKFSLEYAWNALRYEPKWLNLEPMNPTPKTTSSNKRKADGAPGTSNDLNVLAQSPVFNDIIYGRAPQMNYYVNGREYNLSYYLTDGIYPEWATFVKSIQRPQHPKHRLFAEHQEGARKDVERAFGVLQSRFAMIKNPCRFLSKDVWNAVRISNPVKSWAPLVWHKAVIPRHVITSWLFILDRNPTLDRLSTWGFDIELDCLLCGLAHESRNHLFFECVFSTEVWRLVTQRLQISSPPLLWDQILLWLPTASASKHQNLALLQGWQGAIFELWRERNRRFHDGLSVSPVTIATHIFSTMNNKCNAMLQLGLKRGVSLLQCWTI
ncbi:Reverse transcriptase zinc-binding domain [Arabidopsis suecica]|uniref:Reverse transcriptase zinc-binding domain n=1 Tax=Arabidopsis suecica TaxID=45249 RepID=A0A8T2BSZ4_ARASU|nr:Reverse transcriptase zinc-binding domain [Arabidopsis suecica]